MMRRVLLALAALTLLGAADEAVSNVRVVAMFNQHLYYGTFARPRGIAFDRAHNELWIADSGNGLIAVYRPDGAELYAFSSEAYLREPVRVAVAPKGGVVVIEGDRSHLRAFNYRGEYKGDVPLDGLGNKPILGAVAYDAAGNLYVAENRGGQIFIYAASGKLKLQFGSHGTDEGQFQAVCGIAIDKDGTIWVADQQALAVQAFDSQGNFIRGWGKHEIGADHFSLPSGIALDGKGHVLVTDELRHQVKIFTPEGKMLDQFGGLGNEAGQISFPTDVTTDADGRIYVTERGTSRVQVFELRLNTR